MENNLTDEDKKNKIEIWKNIVNVQMHFNEIEMKIKQLALTLFTFIIGGIGYSIKEPQMTVMVGSLVIPLGAIVGSLGTMVIYGLYLMDKHWYHRLLHGAIDPALLAEASLGPFYPEIGLSTSIKKTSPSKLFGKEFHSDGKLRIFYIVLCAPLLISSIILFLNIKINDIKNQYNYIKKNSVQILKMSDATKAPNKAGIVLVFSKENKFLNAIETKDIKNYLSDNLANKNVVGHNIYYSVISSNRKELEDAINEHGIDITPKK